VEPKKNLYEVLEVARNASLETIEAAYRALGARLNARSDPGAKIQRLALEEAYRTLSHPELRRRYDSRLPSRAAVLPVDALLEDTRPWPVRHAAPLIVLALLAVGGYGYYRHVENERAAIAQALREKEALLEQQRVAREEEAQRSADAEQERRRRLEELRHQQWVDQTRREQAAHSRQQEAQRQRDEREAAREQRLADIARQREEAQARARLEQEKRALQRLEAENYRYRRY
jgi:hypothetical protein